MQIAPDNSHHSRVSVAAALIAALLLGRPAAGSGWTVEPALETPGAVRITLKTPTENLVDEVLGVTRWSAPDLLQSAPNSAVREIYSELAPRLQLGNSTSLFFFVDSGGSRGVATVSEAGPRILTEDTGSRFELAGPTYLSRTGRWVGAMFHGVDFEEVHLIDAENPTQLLEIELPPNIVSLERDSLHLTTENAFFLGENAADEIFLLTATLSAKPREARVISGPFEKAFETFAVGAHAVALLAGSSRNRVDVFVATEDGTVVNATNSPNRFIEHELDAPRLAVSNDGTLVAYNLDVDREPEVFVTDLVKGQTTHLTRDEEFNPYLDQESLILFADSGDLFFALGHDPDATDVFRTNTETLSTINLSQTGSTRDAPFLTTGTLDIIENVVFDDGATLLTATESVASSTGLQLFDAQGREKSRIDNVAQRSPLTRIGATIVFSMESLLGEHAIVRADSESMEVFPMPARVSTVLIREDAVWFNVMDVGLISIGELGEPQLMLEASDEFQSVSERGSDEIIAICRRDDVLSLVAANVVTGETVKVAPLNRATELLLASTTEPRFIRGDGNLDGTIDISDPVLILLHLFASGAPLPCDDAADADDNGLLQLTDAVLILERLFKSGTPLPAPHPEMGVDPTVDNLSCGT